MKKYFNDDVKGNVIEYIDENDFKKKERAIRKYNMSAYKKLQFEYYKDMCKGNYPGKEVWSSSEITNYALELPTDKLFKKIYGPITLHYTVYKNRNVVLLTNLTPSEILIEGHKKELNTYKGTIVATEKDLFKAKIFSIMEGK